MYFSRPWSEWIAQYEQSHQHPMNRLTHTFGIPLVALSIALLILSLFMPSLLHFGVVLFIIGWVLQFIGHAFEGKKPEFFNDWRFLFVGLRWWFMKISGKV